jgi:hypothetical protein
MIDEDLRAAAAADRELGRDYEPAVTDAFVDRLGREIDRRVDARLADRGPAIDAGAIVLALGSLGLGLGIPSAMHDHFGTVATFVMTVAGWAAIVAINLAYARRRR